MLIRRVLRDRHVAKGGRKIDKGAKNHISDITFHHPGSTWGQCGSRETKPSSLFAKKNKKKRKSKEALDSSFAEMKWGNVRNKAGKKSENAITSDP